jgi:hypothetical protein
MSIYSYVTIASAILFIILGLGADKRVHPWAPALVLGVTSIQPGAVVIRQYIKLPSC